jgi:UDP-glucose 4-epimerase
VEAGDDRRGSGHRDGRLVPVVPRGASDLTRVLVTGAGGYIGGRLVRELTGRGVDIRVVERADRPWLGALDRRLLDLANDPLEGVCDGVDAIVHLAGPHEVHAARDPDQALSSTIVGTRRIAAAAADAGIRRFVYLSTVHVYGAELVAGATITEATPPRPRHPYAIARLASEHVAQSIMDAVVFRLTNAVGAPADPSVDRWSLVVNDLCRQAVLTGELRLQSDGSAWRDFVPLAEVCRILADASLDGPPSDTYNVAGGAPLTIMAIAEKVRTVVGEIVGREPPIIAPPPSGAPTAPFTVSTDKLSAVGVRIDGAVEPAIRETLAFCLERKDELPRE